MTAATCDYPAALTALSTPSDHCFRRELKQFPSSAVPQLPIYVLTVPSLARRAKRMAERLAAAQVADVTWVTCANRHDIARLDASSRQCLHPEYVAHPWARRGDTMRPQAFAMANGTLSLALKHQLAAFDIARRGIRAGLILEDDATVPSDLWSRLSSLDAPADTDIFYLGSFSSRSTIGTLRSEPLAGGGGVPNWPLIERARTTNDDDTNAASRSRIHRRTAGGHPLLIGGNAYILFAKAAKALLKPVRVEADVAISLLDAPSQCRTQKGTAGKAATPEMCSHLTPPPPNQYGPETWIIGQDLQGLEQKTHWDGGGDIARRHG